MTTGPCPRCGLEGAHAEWCTVGQRPAEPAEPGKPDTPQIVDNPVDGYPSPPAGDPA